MPATTKLEVTGFAASALGADAFASNALTDAKFTIDACGKLTLGMEVQRATATLPQTAAAAIFTIAGGRILLTHIIGEVTTVIQTQANNMKLVANPTVAGSSVDMCAVLNISADPVGELYTITGTLATALVSGLAVVGQAAPLLLQTGTIDLDCSASNTGSVKWTARYIPIDAGATLVAA